ncbi:hypothetical protein Nepgr_032627 [Nepenthes gracilis]|uniref:Uncharacterized protein n=1 Tax=Nepenthes gracilis TaxID=150966 RepID=A0AAD3TKF6_NEPGR|nr:hypothetical protein Nepgr_032627 [Nepenthes gracilis]
MNASVGFVAGTVFRGSICFFAGLPVAKSFVLWLRLLPESDCCMGSGIDYRTCSLQCCVIGCEVFIRCCCNVRVQLDQVRLRACCVLLQWFVNHRDRQDLLEDAAGSADLAFGVLLLLL